MFREITLNCLKDLSSFMPSCTLSALTVRSTETKIHFPGGGVCHGQCAGRETPVGGGSSTKPLHCKKTGAAAWPLIHWVRAPRQKPAEVCCWHEAHDQAQRKPSGV